MNEKNKMLVLPTKKEYEKAKIREIQAIRELRDSEIRKLQTQINGLKQEINDVRLARNQQIQRIKQLDYEDYIKQVKETTKNLV